MSPIWRQVFDSGYESDLLLQINAGLNPALHATGARGKNSIVIVLRCQRYKNCHSTNQETAPKALCSAIRGVSHLRISVARR